jgi:tetratricopeptide (TPR) repeat protein
MPGGTSGSLYRSVTELHPTAAWAHAALGEAYLMSGKRDLAIGAFDRAASLDSTNTVAAEYLRRLRPQMNAGRR